jgi:hypothetical protein
VACLQHDVIFSQEHLKTLQEQLPCTCLMCILTCSKCKNLENWAVLGAAVQCGPSQLDPSFHARCLQMHKETVPLLGCLKDLLVKCLQGCEKALLRLDSGWVRLSSSVKHVGPHHTSQRSHSVAMQSLWPTSNCTSAMDIGHGLRIDAHRKVDEQRSHRMLLPQCPYQQQRKNCGPHCRGSRI